MRHLNRPAMRAALTLIGAAAVALAQRHAGAQEILDIEEAPVPEYRVELIVFEYTDGVNGGLEDWAYIDTGRAAVAESLRPPEEAPLPGELDSPVEEPDGPLMADEPATEELAADLAPEEVGAVQRFELIEPAEYALTDAYARLRSSPDVRPILHTAWRQPVYGPENASTWNLTSIARPPRQLGGSVSLFVSRYLHLTLDLELAELPKSSVSGLGFAESVVYRLSERRGKMRSDELHFFDHPRFGALARITREPDAESAPSEPEAPVETVSR